MYDEQIKADSDIFNLKSIQVQEEYILRPIIAKPEHFDAEIQLYKLNSQSEDIKKYLPAAHVETLENAKEKLLLLIQKGIFKGTLTYCICEKKFPAPLGYICLNSPLTPTGLNTWTIDFWAGNIMRGRLLMTVCIHHLLGYAQEKNIPEIKALVHPDNQKSINVLERVGFGFLYQEDGGEKRYVYGIRLN